MSDYLGNLVNRSTSPDNLVSPRPTSLFEAASAAHPPFAHHLPNLNPEDDELGINETVTALAPQTAVGSTPPSQPIAARPAAPTNQTISPLPAAIPTPPVAQPAPAREKQQPTILPPAKPHHKSLIQHPPDNDPVPIPSPVIQQTIIERTIQTTVDGISTTKEKPASAPEPSKVLEPVVKPLGADPRPRQTTAESETPSPLEPRIEHIEIQRIVEPSRRTVRSESQPSQFPHKPSANPTPKSEPLVTPLRLAPRLEPAIPLPKPISKAAPAPTIDVTIGRIEVRATPPPASKPKKQSAEPLVMSLDEYLRQRVNGGST